MTLTLLFSMVTFSLVMSITPGPVNMMIISSGINHGFKKTFSFVSGATIGFTLLLLLIGLGLSKFYALYPNFFSFLEILGAGFIIYVGYKISTAQGSLEVDKNNQKTLKFYEGFLLQWLNPKAWIAAISGVSMFVIDSFSLWVFVIIYFLVCYLSLSFWGVVGQKALYFFNTNRRLKLFNISMGTVLMISALSLVISNVYTLR